MGEKASRKRWRSSSHALLNSKLDQLQSELDSFFNLPPKCDDSSGTTVAIAQRFLFLKNLLAAETTSSNNHCSSVDLRDRLHQLESAFLDWEKQSSGFSVNAEQVEIDDDDDEMLAACSCKESCPDDDDRVHVVDAVEVSDVQSLQVFDDKTTVDGDGGGGVMVVGGEMRAGDRRNGGWRRMRKVAVSGLVAVMLMGWLVVTSIRRTRLCCYTCNIIGLHYYDYVTLTPT